MACGTEGQLIEIWGDPLAPPLTATSVSTQRDQRGRCEVRLEKEGDFGSDDALQLSSFSFVGRLLGAQTSMR